MGLSLSECGDNFLSWPSSGTPSAHPGRPWRQPLYLSQGRPWHEGPGALRKAVLCLCESRCGLHLSLATSGRCAPLVSADKFCRALLYVAVKEVLVRKKISNKCSLFEIQRALGWTGLVASGNPCHGVAAAVVPTGPDVRGSGLWSPR